MAECFHFLIIGFLFVFCWTVLLPSSPVTLSCGFAVQITSEFLKNLFGRGFGLRQPPLLLTRIDGLGNTKFESQRDSVVKPRVARNELPWKNLVKENSTPRGLRLEGWT